MGALAPFGCARTEVVQSFPDSYVGVGLELTIEGHNPVVVRTLEGGSAASVGVEPGDKVLQIDGQSTNDLTLGNAVMMIRGEPGTQVTLTIDRKTQQMVVIVPRRAMTKDAADYHAAK
jgi:carboxyl-terminal processing protease